MTAGTLRLLFAAPNAETLLYPLVNFCNKPAARNQQPYVTDKAQRVGWTRYVWQSCCNGFLVLCSGLHTHMQKFSKVRAHEPKSHMFAAVMTEPNDENRMLTCLKAALILP